MTWIETIEPRDAEGRLKKLYDQVVDPTGHVDNILTAHSLRPRTLHAHLWLYKATMHTKPNELTNRERELVATCISRSNKCKYCIKHHQAGLTKIVGDEDLAEELSKASVNELKSEFITNRERVFCNYAVKLTLTPGEMKESDLEPLRQVGLSDYGILDLNQIVAYFAYANRTVNGLGVDVVGDVLGLHPSEDTEGFGHS
ncbi:MAG: hypothetical protein HeimC2_09740 [Candidatus Heimdallarchaeota archaeon LC_2]|nr:MAG: hypothetical protein HeimC2_09740 [Candidatus Heimdallarchaeota archaeon LC_2]